jgi:hypothetical protein
VGLFNTVSFLGLNPGSDIYLSYRLSIPTGEAYCLAYYLVAIVLVCLSYDSITTVVRI